MMDTRSKSLMFSCLQGASTAPFGVDREELRGGPGADQKGTPVTAASSKCLLNAKLFSLNEEYRKDTEYGSE